jgi:hypothetical protein
LLLLSRQITPFNIHIVTVAELSLHLGTLATSGRLAFLTKMDNSSGEIVWRLFESESTRTEADAETNSWTSGSSSLSEENVQFTVYRPTTMVLADIAITFRIESASPNLSASEQHGTVHRPDLFARCSRLIRIETSKLSSDGTPRQSPGLRSPTQGYLRVSHTCDRSLRDTCM